jgi:hypothetical protein
VDALNVLVHLLQASESLAYVLEAAGGVTRRDLLAQAARWHEKSGLAHHLMRESA